MNQLPESGGLLHYVYCLDCVVCHDLIPQTPLYVKSPENLSGKHCQHQPCQWREGGEKNLGYQPSCRNSSRYSAWSSDPEGAGGSKDASVHSSLWCKAEAQLSCQVNLKIQVFPKPQKEHSWGQPNSDMSVLWVLTLPHIRATLPLCKGFFLP